jgi:hypothetical protein
VAVDRLLPAASRSAAGTIVRQHPPGGNHTRTVGNAPRRRGRRRGVRGKSGSVGLAGPGRDEQPERRDHGSRDHGSRDHDPRDHDTEIDPQLPEHGRWRDQSRDDPESGHADDAHGADGAELTVRLGS